LPRASNFTNRGSFENLTQTSIQYRDTLAQAERFFTSHGDARPDAQHRAIAWIGHTITDRTAHLSYIDVFAAFALLLTPLALLLRRVELGRASPAH
jgi:hypothetical protein